MRRSIVVRVLSGSTLLLLATVLVCGQRPATGQEQADAKPAAAKKFRGRLPNYYRQVVDEKQRKAIYQIQQEYTAKIAALKAQLEAITKERDEKIVAVLTPEQNRKVDAARAAAKAERDKKKAAEQESAAETPTAN